MHACMDATSCGVMEVSLSVGRQETAELLSIEEVNISGINERVSEVKDRCVALSNHAPIGC
jgi:hypothetical protein